MKSENGALIEGGEWDWELRIESGEVKEIKEREEEEEEEEGDQDSRLWGRDQGQWKRWLWWEP